MVVFIARMQWIDEFWLAVNRFYVFRNDKLKIDFR